MTDWLVAPGNGPFVVALLVMLGLTLVEVVALFGGFGLNDLVDEYVVTHTGLDALGESASGLDVTSGPDGPGLVGRFLAWLYVGQVPVLMILVVFLSVFAALGLLFQTLLRGTLGMPLPAAAAAPIVWVACLPVVRGSVAALARVMPRDETTAVDPESFVGRTAQVTGGTARPDLPAQARVVDAFGTTHYVLVEPEDTGEMLEAGSHVLLVRRVSGTRFTAIANTNPALLEKDA